MSLLQKGFKAVVLCLLFFICFTTVALKAQVTTADVVGTVTDPTKGVIPGAQVTIENVDTKVARTAATNAAGEFTFTLLPIGRYALRVESPGFKTFTVPSIVLASGDRPRVSAVMQLGEVTETVEVQAQVAALQSDTSTIGTVMMEQVVQDLPVNGRNLMALAQLAVGVNEGSPTSMTSGTRPDDRRSSATISVGAQPETVVSYMIDGVDNTERSIGTQVLRPSMDAIAESRVQTNLYTAEVGRTAGGAVNYITKSGTNSYHGTLFEFFRNDIFDAKDFFALTTPTYRLNQYGGSLGGPIRQNKTFFFGDYEGTKIRQGTTWTGSVPTPEMIAGNFSGVANIYDPATTRPDPANPGKYIRTQFANNTIPSTRLNQVAKNFLALYPKPNKSGVSNNYTSTFPKTQDASTFDARVDHSFSQQDLFYARYSFNDTTTDVPGGFPAVNGIYPAVGGTPNPGPAAQRAQGLHLNETHTFNPKLLLELKSAYTRYANTTMNMNYGKNATTELGLPGLNYDQQSSGLAAMSPSGYTALGDGSYLPLISRNNTFQVVGSMSYLLGSHTMKTGASVIRRHVTVYQSATGRGAFNFDNNGTNNGNGGGGSSIASWLLGIPSSSSLSASPIWQGLRTWEPSVYLQDDWRLSNWLTLNLGIRYDVFTPMTEVADRISNFDFTTKKIVVAGQDGVSRTAGIKTDWSNISPRFGFAANLGRDMVIRGGFGMTFVPNNTAAPMSLKNPPYIYSSSFTNDTIFPLANLSQGLPPATWASATNPAGNVTAVDANFKSTYVEQFSLMMQKSVFGNVLGVAYVGGLTRRYVGTANFNVPAAAPGPVTQRRPYYGLYPALGNLSDYTTGGRMNYHSLQVTAERRFSRGLSINSNYTWAHAILQGVSGQDPNNWRADRGNSGLDVRHRFALTGSYQLPFGRSLNGFQGVLVKGWQLNAIGVWQAGLPFSVTNSTARANTGSGDRPNRKGTGKLDDPTIQKWFDTSAFEQQPLYTYGNSGVNILQGPPQRRLNLSIMKRFSVTESRNLEFRSEIFNLTNTASFGNPNGAFGNANFGKISSTQGTPRQIQFALKFVF